MKRAVDETARARKEHLERTGKQPTAREVERHAAEIARRVDQKHRSR
jgi:hypothetical protein